MRQTGGGRRLAAAAMHAAPCGVVLTSLALSSPPNLRVCASQPCTQFKRIDPKSKMKNVVLGMGGRGRAVAERANRNVGRM